MLNLANGVGPIAQTLNLRTLFFLTPLLLLLVAACSSDSDDPIISSEQQAGGPEYAGVIVTTDMAVGVSRIMFGVVNRDGMPELSTSSDVKVYSLVPREDARELKQSLTARS